MSLRERWQDAIAAYDKAIEVDPTFAPGFYKRGLSYDYPEQYEQAIPDYSKSIELEPSQVLAY